MQVPPVCSPHVLPVPSASPSRPGVSMLMLRCEKTPDQAHTCMATFLVVWMCVCSAILYGHRGHGYYGICVKVCFVDVCVCLEFKSLWALRQWVVCMCVSLCVCSDYQCALSGAVYRLNAAGHLQIVCMWVWVCVVSISTCSEDVCHCGNVWNK